MVALMVQAPRNRMVLFYTRANLTRRARLGILRFMKVFVAVSGLII
jgi:hypothetical protein